MFELSFNVLILFQESLQWEEDDRPQLSWWKAKKWAVTVLYKVFERFVVRKPKITVQHYMCVF